MIDSDCRFLLVPHADAGDRRLWQDDQDLRPLSATGREQQRRITEEIGRVDAVFSSPARRCVETVEGLARVSGVEVVLLDDLRETTAIEDHEPWDWWLSEPMRHGVLGAAAAGRMLRAIHTISGVVTTGRAAVGSHGDVIPILVACLSTYFGLRWPPAVDRGGWYEVAVTSSRATIESRGALIERS